MVQQAPRIQLWGQTAMKACAAGRAGHPCSVQRKSFTAGIACRHGALRQAAAGIKGSLPDLADSIYQCIHKKDGRILDEASEKLGAIRAQRQVTPAALCQAHMRAPHFCKAHSFLHLDLLQSSS